AGSPRQRRVPAHRRRDRPFPAGGEGRARRGRKGRGRLHGGRPHVGYAHRAARRIDTRGRAATEPHSSGRTHTPMKRILAAFFALAAGAALAQHPWPARPVTIVVPYPPGGSNDVFARELGKRLSDTWKIPVIVDNRPGAGGSIGAALVA